MMWSSSCSSSRLLPTTTAAALLLPSAGGAASPLLRLRGRPPRLRLAASASSSYNGWGELPDFSFPLLLLHKKKKGLLVLLLLAIPASAVALSRLPPLPLLAAAFAAGFAARHLSFPQPSALTLALADLDAQVRALRDHLASSSHSQPPLHAVDRLRDAVLHATRLAHQGTTPTLAPMGDLAGSLAAWARDAMRDLSTTSSKSKDLGDPKVSPIQDAHNKPPGSAVPSEDMLPFHNDALEDATTRTSWRSNLDLKHRRSGDSSNLLGERTIEIQDRLHTVREAQERVHGRFAGLDPLYDDGAAAALDSDCQDLMKEAAEILKKARQCMMAGADEETADTLLYKSARLLSTAVALRPTSLVAVGQLGNTYLLHGELKLKVSRELRTLLADTVAPLNGRERVPRYRKVDRRILSRDNLSAALVDVCEECENLLVEAGRSYRTALTIDSGDVKALYNWGLALIFRAQLLADIGPEAAVDADRVYLAAIDKFDAMLSKSNTYAPEALYRWGTALQQRSYLRPKNNREKIRLLEQAKSLFEDVLYVEADNKMVREALSSCISELNYHGRWI